MSFDTIPGLLFDILKAQKAATVSLDAMRETLERAYQIKADRESAEVADAPKTRNRKTKVDADAPAASEAKTEAPAPTAPTAAEIVPAADLPPPATPPAQVKPSDVETDRARLVTLSRTSPEAREKALELIRRDDPAAKFDGLSDARRAEVLAALTLFVESEKAAA